MNSYQSGQITVNGIDNRDNAIFKKLSYLQDASILFPNLTGLDHLKFVANIQKLPKTRIKEIVSLTKIEKFYKRPVKTYSLGMKQRLLLAIALINNPEVLLLDEPFSQVDNFRKNELQRTLFTYLKEQNISCIVATHDGKDALSYSDKTLIMRDGKLLFFNNMLSVYFQNTDYYTASLFGEVSWHNGKLFKPQQITITATSDWEATVQYCYFQGAQYLIEATSVEGKVYFYNDTPIEKGEKVWLRIL